MANVWLVHVVPSLGNLLAALMLVSPIPAVLKLRATGKLGDLNPWPLPLTIYNSCGWLAYGFSTANPYLFPSNVIGFTAGIFFTLTAHSAAGRKAQDRIAAIFLTAALHFITLGLVDVFGLDDAAADTMWGINAIVILMVYYLVPLATMADILRSRSAASIYPPLAAAAIANGGLWTIYGMALKAGASTAWGALTRLVQLLLRAIFGAGPAASAVGAGTGTGASPFSSDTTSAALPISTPSGYNLKSRQASGALAGPAGGPSGGLGRGGSGVVSLSVGSGAVSAAAAAAAAAEAPEDHPSAKHKGAKEGRRTSIMQLLHPFHVHSHNPGAGGGSAGPGGGAAGGDVERAAAGGGQG
ncbi:hypothetical protein GPECTOR_6g753 [Gonium pectorale]|uniref:Bidirectional sugar transporter SWEET n=1 Tax=Gonium pectorale TaxID=33097 RepID=A0A150GVI1_GONPE|nr:hypothetical protein GPECTOR_6g753 [Gonium pectorale]|eukprot:KXZ53835.1 hypothetical protein GPECTOR_6g753 [Gonium pectorale]